MVFDQDGAGPSLGRGNRELYQADDIPLKANAQLAQVERHRGPKTWLSSTVNIWQQIGSGWSPQHYRRRHAAGEYSSIDDVKLEMLSIIGSDLSTTASGVSSAGEQRVSLLVESLSERDSMAKGLLLPDRNLCPGILEKLTAAAGRPKEPDQAQYWPYPGAQFDERPVFFGVARMNFTVCVASPSWLAV